VVCDGLKNEAERFSEGAQGEATELRVAAPEIRPSKGKFSVYLLACRIPETRLRIQASGLTRDMRADPVTCFSNVTID
jgi:hypothetical protein